MSFMTVERSSGVPLIRQVHDALRDRILSGTFPPGSKLPSTRELAGELGVSRNVVLEAFDQLQAEGFLAARKGSGTYAAAGAAFRPPELPRFSPIAAVGFRPLLKDRLDFRSGLPDLALFPINVWRNLNRDVWNRITPEDLSYGPPEGRPELRSEIARYLNGARGVRCTADQVVVTAGTTQAIGIVSRLLLESGRSSCIVEDPLTVDIRRIIGSFGGRVLPVPVDGRGLMAERLPRSVKPAFLYVTPSHQFPLGATMPIQRRIRILEYARRLDACIVEDDYDSEFRYGAPPISTLQGLDPLRVIYVGTFSKTLCPAMRIGYIVLPPRLVRRGRELKWFTDLHNASVDQIVLARFIAEGHYARHLHAMKKVYGARRAALVGALTERFGSRVEVLGSAAGIHLCARFRGVRFTEDLLARIERAGARFPPVEEHALRKGRFRDTILIGYGMMDDARLREGVEILFRCLDRTRESVS